MKNTIFLISSPLLRLTNVQMQLSNSKLTFLCKEKKGFFPTQHRHPHVLLKSSKRHLYLRGAGHSGKAAGMQPGHLAMSYAILQCGLWSDTHTGRVEVL